MVTLLCMASSLRLHAQINGVISGSVVDHNKSSVANATILLKNLPDSVVVKTMLSDAAGNFSFENLKEGNYFLQVSSVGFATVVTPSIIINTAQPAQILSPVILQPGTSNLSTVTVRSTKPFIERQVDRTVMNVDAFLSAAGSTALEMLEKAPGVNVDETDGISLRGKSGVMIFIDDKPTYLSGNDLVNYLKSLPASSLDKIEVITNPPARYDAAGNAGIINIRTKKTKTSGFNGGINLNYGQGMYPRSNNSFNFNYRSPKFNFFGNAGYSLNNSVNDLSINRYYFHPDGSPRFTFFQNSFIRRTSQAFNLRMGIDYYLTEKTTLGLITSGITRPSDDRTLNTSTVRNASNDLDSSITADNRQQGSWKNGSINLNLLHKYDGKGKELAADLDYVRYGSQVDQQFYNHAYAPNGNLKWRDLLTGDLPSDISIYSGKLDYTQPLSEKAKISGGIKSSYVSTDNAARYFNTINQVTEPDYDKTNHFLYKETINAAYVSSNRDWKFFSLQLGLRLEHTISNGHQLGNSAKPDSSFRRGYTNLFPTSFFLFRFDTVQRNQLSFSYGRRIDRPVYQDLNPFISPLDKFSIYVGNPYLQPTLTDAFTVAHTFKNKITTTLSYSRTKNIIQETIDLSNNIYISRPANIGKSSVIGLGVDLSLKPAKWWTLLAYGEVQRRYYNDILYGYQLDTSLVYFGSNITNQFNFNNGWSAELSGFYRTDILVGQIISGATGQMNIGVGKKILNNKGSVRIIVRDIFYTRVNHGVITSIRDAYGTYRNWFDSRNATLTFSYNFGKTTGRQRNHNSAVEAEQNRVRN